MMAGATSQSQSQELLGQDGPAQQQLQSPQQQLVHQQQSYHICSTVLGALPRSSSSLQSPLPTGVAGPSTMTIMATRPSDPRRSPNAVSELLGIVGHVTASPTPASKTAFGIGDAQQQKTTMTRADSSSPSSQDDDNADEDHDNGTDNDDSGRASRELLSPATERRLRALDLKRQRNRECMRRARLRKQQELDGMRAEITALEAQLRALQIGKRTRSKDAALTGPLSHHHLAWTAHHLLGHPSNMTTVPPTAAVPIEQLWDLTDALQQENFELRDEIRTRVKLRESIRQLVEQEEQRQLLDEDQRRREMEARAQDQFAWLQHVHPVLGLKAMTNEDAHRLVQESYAEIHASAMAADALIPDPARVFGWSDKRIVDSQWVHFMFDKTFAHADFEDVVARSWDTSSNLDKINAFQPRTQRMTLLQRWGNDTLVIARNLLVPQHCEDGTILERNFATIMLVFRLPTPTGYVIGTRTLEADRVRRALLQAGEHHITYVDLCYGLMFSRQQSPQTTTGCTVSFGGRAGNGTQLYAKVCAMDVLLATLRWENHCIAPLNRLEAVCTSHGHLVQYPFTSTDVIPATADCP